MDMEDEGDTDGEEYLAEGGVREGSGGVGESGMTMAEDDGVAGGRGITDDVGEDGGGIVDGVGGCGIGKAEDNDHKVIRYCITQTGLHQYDT